VKLVGLVSRPELNGADGKIETWDDGLGRWCVLLKDRRRMNLRPENLEAVKSATAKAKSKGRLLGRGKAKEGSKEAKTSTGKLTAGARKTAASASSSGAARAPKKPKKAISGYMLFCRKIRQEVINESRESYGYVSMPEVSREMAFRWKYLDEKEKAKYQRQSDKRKQTVQAKMQAYQDSVDPIGSLKRKYEHLMPKRPKTPFFAFCSDEVQRKKARAALQQIEGVEDARISPVLAEMWKAMPAEAKAPYEQQFRKGQAEFETKMQSWRQTKEYAEIDALERKQKELEQAEKQKQIDAEDAEIKRLLKKGATVGHGLQVGRSAIIIGLTSREDLNGSEVSLVGFDQENDRWVVTADSSDESSQMNLRPENLLWSRLLKELEKVEETAEKEAKQAEKQAEKAQKQAEDSEIQELFKKEGAVPGVGLAEGRCAVVSGAAEEELNGKEVQLVQFDDGIDCWVVSIMAEEGEAAQSSLPSSQLILSGLLKEAQKFEKKQAALASKQQQKESERAAKRAKKETEESELKELLKRGAGAGEGLAAGRTALITGTSRDELNGSEVQLLEFLEETGRWRVNFLGDAQAAPMNLKPENLFLSGLQREIEKNAIKAAKEERENAVKAAKAERKQAEKEMRAEMKAAADKAVKAAKAEQKQAEKEMRAAMKAAAKNVEKNLSSLHERTVARADGGM